MNGPAPNVINACNSEGNTPLHIACKNDKPDCVQALLCSGNNGSLKLFLISQHYYPVVLKLAVVETLKTYKKLEK